MTELNQELELLTSINLQRTLQIPRGLDYASNDFFGLAESPKLRVVLREFLEKENPLGATGSRLVCGHSALTEETEEFLAGHFDWPRALIFGSGYLANMGVLCTLATAECEIFSDEFNHASLVDGVRLSKSKLSIYRHKNLDHLREQLINSSALRKIIVTESLFSMDGDRPDLVQLRGLADEFDCYVILDEAHATGTCGQTGLGLAEGVDFNQEKTVSIHTCGKALGGYGAFILCGNTIASLVINKARTFIYSTALSPIHVVLCRAALSELAETPEHRQRLAANIEAMGFQLQPVGLGNNIGPIISIPIPDNNSVLRAAELLQENGFFVRGIRSPTVPLGTERLRITIKSFHDPADYHRLADILAHITKEMKL